MAPKQKNKKRDLKIILYPLVFILLLIGLYFTVQQSQVKQSISGEAACSKCGTPGKYKCEGKVAYVCNGNKCWQPSFECSKTTSCAMLSGKAICRDVCQEGKYKCEQTDGLDLYHECVNDNYRYAGACPPGNPNCMDNNGIIKCCMGSKCVYP